jgi:stage IV sporulation protein FB
MRKLGNLIKVSPVSAPVSAIAVIIFFITGYGIEYICAFFSISIHEILHIILGKFLNMKVHSIKILPVGLTAEIDEANASTAQKIIMYLFGPLSNAVLFLITVVILKYLKNLNYLSNKIIDIVVIFYKMNLYLAIFNLMPVLPLDGGKILFTVMAKYKGLHNATKYIKTMSTIILSIIISVGIIQLYLFLNFNTLIIGIYLVYLIITIKWEMMFMNIKQLLFRRSRILKKGMYPVRTIMAMKDMTLGDALKNMDFDGFHIVYIFDEAFKIINILTEQDIIDGLIEYNNDITIEEFIKKKL